MIINIRGTSGSGKSTIAYALLRDPRGEWQEDTGYPQMQTKDQRKRKPETLGYRSDPFKLAILGKYNTQCGGCDTIKTQDETEARVKHYAALGYHVLFEGLLVSGLWSRWPALAEAMTAAGRGPWIWAFLDTPLEECLDRVRARRAAVGNTKELNERATRVRYATIKNIRRKAEFLNYDVRVIPYQHAAETVYGWLGLERPSDYEGLLAEAEDRAAHPEEYHE